MASIEHIDKSIFLYFNGKHNETFDIIMYWVSNMLSWIPLAILIGYILIKNFNIESRARLILNISLIFILALLKFIICVYVLPSVIHSFVDRPRPYSDPSVSMLVHLVEVIDGEDSVLFAARACLAFSIVTFLFFSLSEKHKWLKGLLLLWAVLVCYSRIYLGAHFPTSVLISALSGVIVGFVLYRAFFYIKNSVLAI